MIVERMLVERLSGNAVSWKLAMGKKGNPQKPQKIEDSRNIDGEIYASLDEIKGVLQAKLAKFIDDITASAKRRTLAWYGDDLQRVGKKAQKAKTDTNGKIDPDELLEDLEANGGTLDSGIAHVQSAAQDQSNLSEDAQKADVQARLKDMATMTDEDVAAEAAEDGQQVQSQPVAQEEETGTPMGFIVDPDGNRVPVNLKV